jgi:hypothetical protein
VPMLKHPHHPFQPQPVFIPSTEPVSIVGLGLRQRSTGELAARSRRPTGDRRGPGGRLSRGSPRTSAREMFLPSPRRALDPLALRKLDVSSIGVDLGKRL